jgi:hypothetical protein
VRTQLASIGEVNRQNGTVAKSLGDEKVRSYGRGAAGMSLSR